MSEQPADSANSVEGSRILLDPSDPIDIILAGFKQDIDSSRLPTGVEQRKLIAGIHQNSPEAAGTLIRSHKGLIAAVAYSFKAGFVNSRDLLTTGSEALIGAAMAYSLESSLDFSDYAVAAIRQRLGNDPAEEAGTDLDSPFQLRPMERIFHFMADVKGFASPDTQQKQREQERQKRLRKLEKLLTLQAYSVLPHLHLPGVEISEQTGIPLGKLKYVTQEAREKLGAKTRVELALSALENGVQFDIKKPASDKEFTHRERRVAALLAKRNPEIQTELGLSTKQVNLAIEALLRKTGARTRVEVALISQLNYLKPSREETEPYPEALAEFTPKQRQALQLLHLSVRSIAARLNTSYHSVYYDVDLARKKTGVSNTTALALELNRRGVSYDIKKPSRPLVELIDAKGMQIAELLDLPNEDISKVCGLPIRRVEIVVSQMKKKTGARSRVELALMMQLFDTGERRHVARTPREKLAAKLGVEAFSDADIELELQKTEPLERDLISAYYLTEAQVRWKDVGAPFNLHRLAAAAISEKGIDKIRPGFQAKDDSPEEEFFEDIAA